MVAGSIAAHGVEKTTDAMSRKQLCVLLGVLAVGGVLVWLAVRASPGGGIKVPARAVEDVKSFTVPPGQPVVGVYDHVGAVVFTPHRYPRVCGGEMSALINGGFGTLQLPHEDDMTWLIRPPSEVSF